MTDRSPLPPPAPTCHVCGTIMESMPPERGGKKWRCPACGATTGVEPALGNAAPRCPHNRAAYEKQSQEWHCVDCDQKLSTEGPIATLKRELPEARAAAREEDWLARIPHVYCSNYARAYAEQRCADLQRQLDEARREALKYETEADVADAQIQDIVAKYQADAASAEAANQELRTAINVALDLLRRRAADCFGGSEYNKGQRHAYTDAADVIEVLRGPQHGQKEKPIA